MSNDVQCSNCNGTFSLGTYICKHKRTCKISNNLWPGGIDPHKNVVTLASNAAAYDSDTNLLSDNEDGGDEPVVRPLFDDQVWPGGFDENAYINKHMKIDISIQNK